MCNVLVPFTTGVEEIELVAVVDILRRVEINVCMASLDGQPAIGRSGIAITPDAHIETASIEQWDMIVLPGGLPNATLLEESEMVKTICLQHRKQNKPLAAICAAPAALSSFGITKHLDVTSHPSVQGKIEQTGAQYLKQAVVEDDSIITSRGAGTAIAFALHLVTKLKSKALADDIKSAILA